MGARHRHPRCMLKLAHSPVGWAVLLNSEGCGFETAAGSDALNTERRVTLFVFLLLHLISHLYFILSPFPHFLPSTVGTKSLTKSVLMPVMVQFVNFTDTVARYSCCLLNIHMRRPCTRADRTSLTSRLNIYRGLHH